MGVPGIGGNGRIEPAQAGQRIEVRRHQLDQIGAAMACGMARLGMVLDPVEQAADGHRPIGAPWRSPQRQQQRRERDPQLVGQNNQRGKLAEEIGINVARCVEQMK